jgi:NitT/TauT family transport system substrate-binding protein
VRIPKVLGVAAVTAMLVPLAACGSSSSDSAKSTETVTITYYPGTMVSLPIYVANEEGLWAKHGIKVKTTTTKDGTTAVAALASGSLDLAINLTESFMILRDKGQAVEAVVGAVGYAASTIVARKGADTPHAGSFPGALKDLVGKKVGVAALGGMSQLQVESLMKTNGLDPAAVDFVAIGAAPPATLGALKAAQVDFVVTTEPQPTLAAEQGVGQTVLKLSDVPEMNPWIFNAYFGQSNNLKDHPKKFENFKAAYDEAIKFIQDPAHRDEVVKIATEVTKLPENVARTLLDSEADRYTADVSAPAVENVSQFLVSNKVISAPVTYDDLVWGN